jgi:aminomethyltransferase
MTDTPNQTPLHDWHVAQGANMTEFAGYRMPLWYPAGMKREHRHAITHAALFDTSHMAVVTVSGPDALDLLQYCFSKDLDRCIGAPPGPLVPGRSVYGVFLNSAGEVIDDAIVFQEASEQYMVVVNAGMGAIVSQHLADHLQGRAAQIVDWTDRVGKIDLQGPNAARILALVLEDAAQVFEKMFYFAFKGRFNTQRPRCGRAQLQNGLSMMVSRTGYTGEFGFELFMEPQHLVTIWEQLLAAGQAEGLIASGLGARDSLRAGAGLPLSHQDIGDWLYLGHPWTFTLPYTEDGRSFSKTFIGSEMLAQASPTSWTYAFVGSDARKVSSGGRAQVLDAEGQNIGTVLSCTTDVAIGRHEGQVYSIASPTGSGRPDEFDPKGLRCGFVRLSQPQATGQTIVLQEKRRLLEAVIVDEIRPHRTARRALNDML